MRIKELIQNNTVQFDSFRQGFFYYNIQYNGNTYQFTVPLEDIGTATMLATDKAIAFMRWIRKSMADNTFIKIK